MGPELKRKPEDEERSSRAPAEAPSKGGGRGRGLSYAEGVAALTPDGARPEEKRSEGRPSLLSPKERQKYLMGASSRLGHAKDLYNLAVVEVADELSKASKNSSAVDFITDLMFSFPLISGVSALIRAGVSKVLGADVAKQGGRVIAKVSSFLAKQGSGVAIKLPQNSADPDQVKDAFHHAASAKCQAAQDAVHGLDDVELVTAYHAYDVNKLDKAAMRRAIRAEIANLQMFVDNVGLKDRPDMRIIQVETVRGTKEWWKAKTLKGESASGPASKPGLKFELMGKVPSGLVEASREADRAMWGTIITCQQRDASPGRRLPQSGATVAEVYRTVDLG